MGIEVDDWDDVSRRVVDDLTSRIQREYYMRYIGEMRTLDTLAEKLIYLYLALVQPQTSTSLRRGLNINRNTVRTSLQSLSRKDVLTCDEGSFWWINKIEHKMSRYG